MHQLRGNRWPANFARHHILSSVIRCHSICKKCLAEVLAAAVNQIRSWCKTSNLDCQSAASFTFMTVVVDQCKRKLFRPCHEPARVWTSEPQICAPILWTWPGTEDFLDRISGRGVGDPFMRQLLYSGRAFNCLKPDGWLVRNGFCNQNNEK